jgi:chorismate binding enzyme
LGQAVAADAGSVAGATAVDRLDIGVGVADMNAGFPTLQRTGGDVTVIRTMLMKGKKAYLQAGAGIVADSVPESECQECLNKAQALVRAVELARSGA